MKKFDVEAVDLKGLRSMLPDEPGKAIRSADLEKMWGLNAREVRLVIAAIRKKAWPDGMILVAGNVGFYLTKSPGAIRTWLGRCKNHVNQVKAIMKVAERALEDNQ